MSIIFLDLDGTLRETKSGQTFINEPPDTANEADRRPDKSKRRCWKGEGEA